MAKSNYFSNTHALQTCLTINGVRSLVAYSMLLVRDRGIMEKFDTLATLQCEQYV